MDLGRKIGEFTRLDPYERVIEPDPNTPEHCIYKIKLTKPIPDGIADIVGDLAHNLRSALDNAGYAVAVASGVADPKFSAFPFAGSVNQMVNALGRAKDVPHQIQSLFCGFQPYLRGDDLLWALNEICNGDKHKMLTPIGVGTFRTRGFLQGTGFVSMPSSHVWNRDKNEMEVFTARTDAKLDYNFDFSLFIAFNDIQIVEGEPVLRVLETLFHKVERILLGIEAECRRLKIIP